ncbi:helix-turn-helix domain-containing protein [Sulfurimonas sediminis]|uniref:Helix-turn-helix domain-containing protein n=1 Tax=Sulfurimonas sediminis TaxID=2590020 RepID=A0A7M1AYG0_9BACT|nr:helix-turn-helix domain-containing protein [Sulfurimonas sediminis]QOP42481.1 helix-turn-helix domain-containing protein [Sulfurimonas sediminis]
MEKRYYRAKEIAVYLGVTITTVWNYSSKGLLTPIKLTSNTTVFDIEEVEKFIESKTAKVA